MLQLLSALPNLKAAVAVTSSHPKAVPADKIVEESVAATAGGVDVSVVSWEAATSMTDALKRANAALAPKEGEQPKKQPS